MYMRGLYTISAERNQERKVNKTERKCIFATVFPAGHNGLKPFLKQYWKNLAKMINVGPWINIKHRATTTKLENSYRDRKKLQKLINLGVCLFRTLEYMPCGLSMMYWWRPSWVSDKKYQMKSYISHSIQSTNTSKISRINSLL